MCYDVQAFTKKILKYAESRGATAEEIAVLIVELEKLRDKKPIFHTNGYDHSELPVFTNEKPLSIQFYKWGLVPNTYRNVESALSISHKTLNARSETVFELSSFKESISCRRCLIMVDGFYEHHHRNGKTYPFFIQKASKEPMYLAGIYDSAKIDGETINSVSILTTKGNELMSKIHNNPKMTEARMPVILDKEDFDQWFNGKVSDSQDNEISELFQSYNKQALEAFTVNKIRGKGIETISEKASEMFQYRELPNGVTSIRPEDQQLSLF
jgi:putative SOS response-associated peptidase YedK